MNTSQIPHRPQFYSPCTIRLIPCLLATFLALPSEAAAGDNTVQLVGIAEFSGTATDLSGQKNQLENGEPHNRLGGFSALEYSGKGNRFVALPDRGPDDGATGYLCRVQHLEIHIDPAATPAVTMDLVGSTMLTDRSGRRFTGDSTAYVPTTEVAERLDPEGFRFSSDGSFFVSDEYGPQLIQFSANGREQQRYTLPEHLTATIPAATKQEENLANVIGRSSNKGMEGLAISPDGKTLYGIMQHVLLQDGVRAPGGIPTGVNCRLVQVDVDSGAVREYVYQLDAPTNGLNEIVALNDDEFLVIERDGKIGADAAFKKIMKISIAGATEIQRLRQLPVGDLPSSIQPVRKEVFIDFLDPSFQLTPEQLPEKLEGLTKGPSLPNGRQTLLVSSDNDFNAESPSLIYVFAMPTKSQVAQNN